MSAVKTIIVEDEKIVALDLKRRLLKMGYLVIGIVSSEAQYDNINDKHSADIILMDINIKGATDGISLAEKINQSSGTPIIYLTAYSEENTLSRAKKTKPYGYLLKPCSDRDLDVTLQVAMERFRADQVLKEKEIHLSLALEAAGFGTWELDCNQQEILVIKQPVAKDGQIMSWNSFWNVLAESEKNKLSSAITQLKSFSSKQLELEVEISGKNNYKHWVKLYGRSYIEKKQSNLKLVGTIKDVTENHEIEETLKQAATVFHSTDEGIAILDGNKKIININTAFYKIFGYQYEEVIGSKLDFLAIEWINWPPHQSVWKVVRKKSNWRGEIKALTKKNKIVSLQINISSVPDSQDLNVKYVVVLSDISSLKAAQEKLSHIAYYDGLTNLPNRALLLDRFKLAIDRAQRNKKLIAILFIDLDHFKRINDTMGHQVGDLMLKQIAKRFESRVRKTDVVSRLGGDEFVVLMEDIESIHYAEALADALLSILSKPLMLKNTEVIPSGSIGISIFPHDAQDQDALIQMADTAMYSAKDNGRNRYAFYTEEMTRKTLKYLVKEQEILRAIKNNELELYYQPIVSASPEGTHIILEALLRWNHPKLGILSADEIIPYAEMGLLILEIGKWVIEEAGRHVRFFHDTGMPNVQIAVNVSIKQFINQDLVAFITLALRKNNISPKSLKIEITESLLQNEESVLTTLKALDNLGIEIALDDFGTGYSCLSSLKNLPIKYLKIDRSFVNELPNNKDDCAIASTIVAMGHQLNKKIIAEGIENENQLAYLKSLGCDYFQGFYISKPKPLSAILREFRSPKTD